MATVTTRPNATLSDPASWALTGAASKHAALNDNSDSSYIANYAINDTIQFGDAEPTIPAGGLVKSVAMRVRCSRVGTGSVVLRGVQYDGGEQIGENASITVSSPTIATVTLVPARTWMVTPTDLRSNLVITSNPGATATLRLYELYEDTIYVAQPVAAISSPTGSPTLTTTNKASAVWANTLDADGGAATYYEVKVFDDATYGGGGFNPTTSTAYDETSGIVAGNPTSWNGSVRLVDDTYRVYVRVAQTVNGAQHWSEWDFEQFTVDVDLPGVPSLTAIPDDDDGRMILDLVAVAGAATTDFFEVERSTDNVTWASLRTVEGDGIVTNTDGAETVYDWEGGNGETVYYRARAGHDHGSGLLVVTAWSTTDSDNWASDYVWLKHPTNPDLNVSFR